ncbi:conjugative transposon protein TraM [Croceitalea marina]|uniref:Conjugative transposon protein TraM n=1 Tax=Croceitalea marina TaxID=1775166 RepID=A0ABW5MSC7_9FLAO
MKIGNTKNIQAFKRWVVRYRNFAIALPIALILTSFFVVENVKKFNGSNDREQVRENGLNLELPGKQPDLDVKENTGLRTVQQNSEATENTLPPGPSMEDEKKSEKDSLQEIVKQLEALSLDIPKKLDGNPNSPSTQRTSTMTKVKEPLNDEEQKQRMVEQRLAYREMLQEGKEKIVGSTGNTPSRNGNMADETNTSGVFRAAVYRDQFILPGDNVELILLEDMVLGGKFFRKNTFVYALASIQGNRVLLDIDNINHVQVQVTVKDYRDGREGIYNKRAGELWREFSAEVSNDAIERASNSVVNDSGGLVRDMVSEVGTLLRSKRLKQRDRILLVNDHEVLLLME